MNMIIKPMSSAQPIRPTRSTRIQFTDIYQLMHMPLPPCRRNTIATCQLHTFVYTHLCTQNQLRPFFAYNSLNGLAHSPACVMHLRSDIPADLNSHWSDILVNLLDILDFAILGILFHKQDTHGPHHSKAAMHCQLIILFYHIFWPKARYPRSTSLQSSNAPLGILL
jgi:hypothetical protein